MGVSCITITIEEFERLKEAQKKELAIESIIIAVNDTLEKANPKILTAGIIGDMEEAKKIIKETDRKLLDFLSAIEKIINNKGGADNEERL